MPKTHGPPPRVPVCAGPEGPFVPPSAGGCRRSARGLGEGWAASAQGPEEERPPPPAPAPAAARAGGVPEAPGCGRSFPAGMAPGCPGRLLAGPSPSARPPAAAEAGSPSPAASGLRGRGRCRRERGRAGGRRGSAGAGMRCWRRPEAADPASRAARATPGGAGLPRAEPGSPGPRGCPVARTRPVGLPPPAGLPWRLASFSELHGPVIPASSSESHRLGGLSRELCKLPTAVFVFSLFSGECFPPAVG